MKTQLIWNPLSSNLTYFNNNSSQIPPINAHRKIMTKSNYETAFQKSDINYLLEKEASELKQEFQV